jgi:glycosyltransferase involved in cell wall biosynthesis
MDIDFNSLDDYVSIITPAFNAEKTIVQTIHSVLNQTVERWELIIVDDNSSDKTLKVVDEFCAKDKRIKIFSNSHNLGAAQSRNVGLQIAKGRFVAFLDADDEWLPERLAESLRLFKQNKGTVITCSAYRRRSGASGKFLSVVCPPSEITWQDILSGNPIGCLTVTIDRGITGDIKFKKIEHEDMALWVELTYKFGPAKSSKEITAIYSVASSSLSGKKNQAFRWYLSRLNEIKHISNFERLIFTLRYLKTHLIRRILERIR